MPAAPRLSERAMRTQQQSNNSSSNSSSGNPCTGNNPAVALAAPSVPSTSSSFHVVVRCRRINHREVQTGAQRFPYRKDLNFQCALVASDGTSAAGEDASQDLEVTHVHNGCISLFDPDSTAVLHRHTTSAQRGGGPCYAPSLQEGERRYPFHDVFGAAATNQDVFRVAVLPLVRSVLEGYHGTCFAYGMTGSGKSYTMVGAPPLRPGEERSVTGMCHLALRALFDAFAGASTPSLQIHATYIELYNERIRDLLLAAPLVGGELDDSVRHPEIWDDPHGGTSLRHASTIAVGSLAALEVILEQGNVRRTKASTSTNECSSRSHAILQLTIQRSVSADGERAATTGMFIPSSVACKKQLNAADSDGNDGDAVRRVVQSRLTLVDLAGSERAHATSDLQTATATDKMDRRREGANINKSLLALGNCITALGVGRDRTTSTTSTHIPYRDSKLTRLLRDALGGNTKTVMIATISPSCLCFEETLSTLKYATRAASIVRTVTCNASVAVVSSSGAAKQTEPLPPPRSTVLANPPPPLPPGGVHRDPTARGCTTGRMAETSSVAYVDNDRNAFGYGYFADTTTGSTRSSSNTTEASSDARRQHLLELEANVVGARTQLRVAQVTEAKLYLRQGGTRRVEDGESVQAHSNDSGGTPSPANHPPTPFVATQPGPSPSHFFPPATPTTLPTTSHSARREDQMQRLQQLQHDLKRRLAQCTHPRTTCTMDKDVAHAANEPEGRAAVTVTCRRCDDDLCTNHSTGDNPSYRTTTTATATGQRDVVGVAMRSSSAMNAMNTTYVVGGGKRTAQRLSDVVAAHWAHERTSVHAKTIDAFLLGST